MFIRRLEPNDGDGTRPGPGLSHIENQGHTSSDSTITSADLVLVVVVVGFMENANAASGCANSLRHDANRIQKLPKTTGCLNERPEISAANLTNRVKRPP